MAQRADELRSPRDPLLAAYLEAKRRYDPVPPRLPVTDDLLLTRYLRARRRLDMDGGPAPIEPDVRTCTSCGRREAFAHESGFWASCSRCGAYA